MTILRKAPRTLPRHLASRSRRKSRGQALVEFALFVPLLMLIVIGATDISTLLDDHLDVVFAARAGARVGSVIGSYSPASAPYTADCAVVGAVRAALASTRNVTVTQIAIYKSAANGDYSSTLPQDVYPGNATCQANGMPSPSATKTTWTPSARSATPFIEDSIGVAITYTYTFQFNPLGGGTIGPLTDSAVMPIEIVVTPSTPTPTP